jgi:hypothetical protein
LCYEKPISASQLRELINKKEDSILLEKTNPEEKSEQPSERIQGKSEIELEIYKVYGDSDDLIIELGSESDSEEEEKV